MGKKGEREEPKLSDEQRVFVVTSLAMYDRPTMIRDVLKDEHGVTVSVQAIEGYNPERKASKSLAKQWVDLFWVTRKAFLEDTSSIPIAQRAVRLRALDRMAAKTEKQGNVALSAQLHEQAAKEVGDVYTNTRKLAGHDGGAIKTETESAIDLSKATVEQLRALATLRIAPANNRG